MSKWLCSCKAINPSGSAQCHCCGKIITNMTPDLTFDLIEELKKENNRLREALRKIALEEYGRPTEMMLIARKALEKSE